MAIVKLQGPAFYYPVSKTDGAAEYFKIVQGGAVVVKHKNIGIIAIKGE
jgi:hypothetical protein